LLFSHLLSRILRLTTKRQPTFNSALHCKLQWAHFHILVSLFSFCVKWGPGKKSQF
jgi:hypothetical protein